MTLLFDLIDLILLLSVESLDKVALLWNQEINTSPRFVLAQMHPCLYFQ